MALPLQKDHSENKSYGIGLDIIRIIAMFFVIMVHSTTFYGFKSEGVHSIVTAIAGAGRYLSYSCVPIFLLLTGYLTLNKKPEISYYLKLVKILIEFYLCALAVAIFQILCVEGSEPFFALIKKAAILAFPQYSWYMRMYLGLFLLAPFFNYIINSLSGKQAVLLTVISVILFSNPFISDFWQWGYPIMYYFIGSILRKTQFRAPRILCLSAIPIMSIIGVVLYKYPVIPRFDIENYSNFVCLVISVSLFMLFSDIKFDASRKFGGTLVKITRTVANASMSTYLLSVIFDNLTTQLFSKLNIVTFSERFPFLLYLTPLKFILSILCAIPISILSAYLFKMALKIINKITSAKNAGNVLN